MITSKTNQSTLPTTARVWVYQSGRELNTTDSQELEKLGSDFVEQWASHGNKLSSSFEVRHNRFAIIMVDESQAGASGCSIDTSVHFMQEMEQRFATTFFDRMILCYLDAIQNSALRTCSPKSCKMSEIPALITSGELTSNTLIFDNTVISKGDLDARWQVKMGDSWAGRYF
jgi:hypothetical protein